MCDIQVMDVRNKPNKRIFDLILASFRTHCTTKDKDRGKGGVAFDYGRSQLKRAHYILVALKEKHTRSGAPITTVCGFLFLNHFPRNKEAYIDIVCSRMKGGIGGALIKEAERFARFKLKCDTIRLSALNEVYTYYLKKHQYVATNQPCSNKPILNKYDNKTNNRKGSYGDGFRLTKCLRPIRNKDNNNNKYKQLFKRISKS